jgi:ATP-dependent Clp protease ATP-binding subunit ClpB
MTSNLGGDLIHDVLQRTPQMAQGDETYEALERDVMEVLRRHFRPEFLNRVDETILFHSLRREQLTSIVEIQLQRVHHFLAEKKIDLSLDDEAKGFLANEGYDPAFGARPLKRAIQKHVVDALARKLLDGSLEDGQKVECTCVDGGLLFTVRGASAAA